MTDPVMRYERKFVAECDVSYILAAITMHPALFREAYPPRFVNSLYFDTPVWTLYWAHVKEAERRVKVRIRWYGELSGKIALPVLEVKSKFGAVGAKRQWRLPEMYRGLSGQVGERAPGVFPLGDPDIPFLGQLLPVMVTRYHRRYYVSADGRFRVTVDSGLRNHAENMIEHEYFLDMDADRRIIIELKYVTHEDMDASQIVSRLPFRLSKYSKYVQAVSSLYGI